MTEAELDEAADALDLILLRRDKLTLLVARLRAVHLKLTRTRRYWPIIRPNDSKLEEAYAPLREAKPWQARPGSHRKGRIDDNPKGMWRKAKAPW